MPRVIFINHDGTEIVLDVPAGSNVLEIAKEHDIDIEGACGGSCSCSTCHVIVDPEYYHKLPPISDEEENQLDLAFGLESTSRLACQINITNELDGIRLRLPSYTRNINWQPLK